MVAAAASAKTAIKAGGRPAATQKRKAPPASSNVRVVSRIRPLAKYELEKGCKSVVLKVPNLNPGGPETLQINAKEKRWFELDAILDQESNQDDVYKHSGAADAICTDLFQGFNCTILAYGQTGSGKTWTMGTANKSSTGEITETDGVIPRACQDLFDTIATKCDSNAHVELSYMEVYNEEIRDLLNPQKNVSAAAQLRIRETLNGEVYVRGLQSRTVANPAEIGNLMEEAGSRRVTASTKMNAVSSRSHAICVLRIKGVLEDSSKFQAKLTLVDLAGSERIKKTEAKGSRAQEGISINKGLFVLGQCVSALSEQRPKFKRKPPFRDSKLTRLLQDSLGGNSRTIMVACCSPADFNMEETVNTLRYAAQARNIKNTATANVVQEISQEEAMKLRRENALLKTEVTELQETIKKLTQDVSAEDLHRSRSLIQMERQNSCRSGMAASVASSHLSPARKQPEMTHPDPSKLLGKDPNDDSGDDDDDDVLSPLQEPKNGPSLGDHFGSQKVPPPKAPTDGDISLALEDVLPGLASKSVGGRTMEELEEENSVLSARLVLAQHDVRATVHDAAVELPALKVKLQMLEEELNESHMLEAETMALKKELEEAKADKQSATRAAEQLSNFMENLKTQTGFRGDELQKKRLWYFHKRLDENWVSFVVEILGSFREQMRVLGDYFEMVVRVVESPDILSMLGPAQTKKKNWWSKEKDVAEEQDLRHRLLGEHIKFFNARLIEIEDEIHNRSESVDAILDGLGNERQELEGQLDETEFVSDIFSKKGEKLLKHLTELLTGPLFTLPLVEE